MNLLINKNIKQDYKIELEKIIDLQNILYLKINKNDLRTQPLVSFTIIRNQ